jgi:putative transposase
LQLYSFYSVGYYCKLFGKSRQAYYEQRNAPIDHGFEEAMVMKLVKEIRQELPRCGVDKMHYMLQEKFANHHLKIGRDKLYELVGKYGMLVRYRNRKP